MKALYFLIPLFFVNACKTQTGTVISSENTKMEQVENKVTGCPEEGTCSVMVHKNKRLVIKEDGTGATYPEMAAGENMVVVYTYSKEGPEGTVDGDYSETIHFEIPTATTTLRKVDASLTDVNLLYGKHCFCKGEAGYYPVTNGKLLVEKSSQGITFDLKFKVEKTSQVVTHISEMVKM
ncbi:hypothetical protein [Aequorivita lipolytica]|uniref:Uncharacterized protein n=1 Tax=Aequorivita lipolytica TaxID=153267 RepID=A0A5C6YRG5_9FLAO|nr:hypothetical protein [Aequorivita lipolytica]TXD69977.1 hypothetical protein ESV24_05965 [Aequorivita lipolytica]SRX50198.1 hypothetical protein AEQU2_00667 [Aequorivita lipolytica]